MDNATDRTCKLDDCLRFVAAKGFCNAHYGQQARGKPFSKPRTADAPFVPCRFEGCEKGGRRTNGLCSGHYMQHHRGQPLTALRKQVDPAHPTGSPCTFNECDRPIASLSLCTAHYEQVRRGVALTPIRGIAAAHTGWINVGGYRAMSAKGHPNADRLGRILEHRFVMAEHLGRPLRDGENVHHVNGDKLDNRIENLELWSSRQPPGQRVADKVAWAREILALYGDDF